MNWVWIKFDLPNFVKEDSFCFFIHKYQIISRLNKKQAH
jgi:hypothetical protein